MQEIFIVFLLEDVMIQSRKRTLKLGVLALSGFLGTRLPKILNIFFNTLQKLKKRQRTKAYLARDTLINAGVPLKAVPILDATHDNLLHHLTPNVVLNEAIGIRAFYCRSEKKNFDKMLVKGLTQTVKDMLYVYEGDSSILKYNVYTNHNEFISKLNAYMYIPEDDQIC